MKRIFFLAAIAICALLLSCAADRAFDEEAWRKRVASADPSALRAAHEKDGRYFNPWMPMEDVGGFSRFLRWKFSPKGSYTAQERSHLPAVLPGTVGRIHSLPADQDFILWIGHASFLIRIGAEIWLTDPMFSDRALLPKRRTPPALTAEDIRQLGAKRINVVISHNHYDHLDTESLRALPDGTRIFVPLGLKDFVSNLGKSEVVEMDWWQTIDCGSGVLLHCLPMQHWSRRICQGRNKTLWASFLIAAPESTIYFGGDSGYFIGYREIGRMFPDIDYALMPVTAYHPRWFMHYAHMNIDEALDAFDDLRARFFIPTQWGAFDLGDEPAGYPGLDLERTIKKRNVDPLRMLILDVGQIVPIEKKAK
ncbi:MAG: metal-dependent hydrolase [Syntrophaceae bacterium PtaU1.Bin231]|nr:MAG: metal-dependent hydrolase [Syntrophaceae bacterium PtaU1.Bin231]